MSSFNKLRAESCESYDKLLAEMMRVNVNNPRRVAGLAIQALMDLSEDYYRLDTALED